MLSMRSILECGLLALAAVPLVVAAPVLAAPTNDLCANAIPVSLNTVYAWDLTVDTGTERITGCHATKQDIFYDFVAPQFGYYQFDTQVGVFNSALSIYNYAPNCDGIELACNRGEGTDHIARGSRISNYFLGAHQRISIRVAALDVGGQSVLTSGRLAVTSADFPANNDCLQAQVVTLGTTTFANSGAYNEATWSCGGQNDVFFSFTPSQSGRYHIDFAGSMFNVIGMFIEGSCSGTAIGCGNNTDIDLRAGVPVIIRASGWGCCEAERGFGQLNIAFSQVINPAANDSCGSPELIGVGSTTMIPSLFVGTADGSSSCSAGLTASQDVWYRIQASFTGTVLVETCSTVEADTVLGVRSGSCDTGTSVACNDIGCAKGLSRVTFAVANGQNYYIRIGASSRTFLGGVTLSVSQVPAGSVVTNDTCATAKVVTEGSYAFDNTFANTETIPNPSITSPDYGRLYNDLWYTYTAPADGQLTLDPSTSGTQYGACFDILSGNCAGSVLLKTIVNANIGYYPIAKLCMTSGQKIYIRMGFIIDGHAQTHSGSGTLVVDFKPTSNYMSPPSPFNIETESCGSRLSGTKNNDSPYDLSGGSIVCGQAIVGTIPQRASPFVEDVDHLIFTRGVGDTGAVSVLMMGSAKGAIIIDAAAYSESDNFENGPIVNTTSCVKSFSNVYTMVDFGDKPTPYWVYRVRSGDAARTGACGANEEYWFTLYRLNTGAITISSHPSSKGAALGSNVSFSVGATGTGLQYQWRSGTSLLSNGGRFSGTTSPTLTITGFTSSDIGQYSVIVTSGCSAAVSSAAALSVQTCVADFNNTGTVTVTDIFAFLSAWFAGNIAADANGSGTVTVQDIFFFLSRWFSGC